MNNIMNLLALKISRDIESNKKKKQIIPDCKKDENENKKNNLIKTIKEHSPKTLRKNLSNDNFMKFQWPWLF